MEYITLQKAIQAIRSRFGPADASIKLLELLFFLEGLQNSPSAPGHAEKGLKQSLKRKGLESSVHAFNSPQPQTQAQAQPQPQPHVQAQSQPHVQAQSQPHAKP
jgi:hypothetical protein